MMEFENRSGLKKYLDIYKERIIISLKESNEYKINFYLMNLFDIFHLITHLLLFYILISQFTEIFDWNLTDFAIYWFLNLISWKVLWLHNLRNFNLTLLKGDLNKDILRPVNTYFLSSIENIFGQNLISLIYVIPIIVFLILKNGYSFTFLNIIYIIFSWFYFMIMFNVINSTAFFMKKNMFIKEIFFRTESTINRFTPKTFETFPIKSIIYLMPTAIMGYFVIELFKLRYDTLLYYLPYIVTTFIVCILILIIMWHFGLKKYEAYG